MRFAGLALVIIDEQHRFGVHQRLALWEKGVAQGFHPHQLMYDRYPHSPDAGDHGRNPGYPARAKIIQRVRQACLQKQGQAYWICTLIEESDGLEAQASEAT